MDLYAAWGAFFSFTIFSFNDPKDIKDMHLQSKFHEVLSKIAATRDYFVFFRFINFLTDLKLQVVIKSEPMDI